jgi:hypothetical protein
MDRRGIPADGGGRGLAYVAVSRARETSQVYVVADDTTMAIEDLRRDCQRERGLTWAIDTGLPATSDLTADMVAAMGPDDKAWVIAIDQAETAGSGDQRRALFEKELAAYRGRLEDPSSTGRGGWTFRVRGCGGWLTAQSFPKSDTRK